MSFHLVIIIIVIIMLSSLLYAVYVLLKQLLRTGSKEAWADPVHALTAALMAPRPRKTDSTPEKGGQD
jgi:hypothetical protein